MYSEVGIINIPRKLSDHDLVPQIVKTLDVEPAVRGDKAWASPAGKNSLNAASSMSPETANGRSMCICGKVKEDILPESWV